MNQVKAFSAKGARLLLQVNVGVGGVDSTANVTEIHEAFHFDEMEGHSTRSHFAIFSIEWAANGREVVAGTGISQVLIFDAERGKVQHFCFSCTHLYAIQEAPI